MAAREVGRRAGILMLFAGYLALCGLTIASTGETWSLVAWGGFAAVGALLLLRRSGNAIGRILLGLAVYWGLYGAFTIPRVAEELPVVFELTLSSLGYGVWMLLPVLIVVFPTGRVTTRLGRIVTVLALGVVAIVVTAAAIHPGPLAFSERPNPLGIPAAAPLSAVVLGDDTFLAVPLVGAVALVDLVLRWRRADGPTRLQFRWLAYGTAVTVLILGSSLLFEDPLLLVTVALTLGINAIPVAIWIAVTRHGLYEIGRVVSRTVSYAIVTAVVIGIYVVAVTSTTWLVPDLPALGVAVATLAAAAIFLPVLRVVQRRVDRRFDREHFDAQKTVDGFGERLRTGTDPAATSDDLLAAVEGTLQPRTLGIWVGGAT
ncbi:hypothetical protein [Microbacterium sp. ABRD28]|uniref:hypothetical protein n=1 Tax=Microbacterium sp. ABRD28 TaxID=2268461 RepID=UPI000F550AC0|nr:hypothetical protein [Microbacterium sp. ABRD28]AZC14446.1 hypothetical protein DT073_12680 [Microbacterium sp. ABRD28]